MGDFVTKTPDLQLIFELLLAAFLGWCMGWERKHWKKPAGGRTFMLIALGSCLFSIISIESVSEFVGRSAVDPTRIASNILTGIGFIGAGIILHRGEHVEGVTSAAAIWVAAAVGMAAAFHLFMLAVMVTLMTVIGLNLSYATRKIVSRVSPHKEGEEDMGADA